MSNIPYILYIPKKLLVIIFENCLVTPLISVYFYKLYDPKKYIKYIRNYDDTRYTRICATNSSLINRNKQYDLIDLDIQDKPDESDLSMVKTTNFSLHDLYNGKIHLPISKNLRIFGLARYNYIFNQNTEFLKIDCSYDFQSNIGSLDELKKSNIKIIEIVGFCESAEDSSYFTEILPNSLEQLRIRGNCTFNDRPYTKKISDSNLEYGGEILAMYPNLQTVSICSEIYAKKNKEYTFTKTEINGVTIIIKKVLTCSSKEIDVEISSEYNMQYICIPSILNRKYLFDNVIDLNDIVGNKIKVNSIKIYTLIDNEYNLKPYSIIEFDINYETYELFSDNLDCLDISNIECNEIEINTYSYESLINRMTPDLGEKYNTNIILTTKKIKTTTRIKNLTIIQDMKLYEYEFTEPNLIVESAYYYPKLKGDFVINELVVPFSDTDEPKPPIKTNYILYEL